MSQQGGFSWPSSGATGWDTPLKANIEALRTAHNDTDTVAAAATTAAAGKYSKPGGGIPKSDLSTAAQASLTAADSALQQETYASALPGQRFDLPRVAGNWVARPTTRPDIFFDWRGALPAPNGVTVNALVGDAFVEEG